MGFNPPASPPASLLVFNQSVSSKITSWVGVARLDNQKRSASAVNFLSETSCWQIISIWPSIELKAVRTSSVRSTRLAWKDSIGESLDVFRLIPSYIESEAMPASVRSIRLAWRDSIWKSPDLFRLLVALGGLLSVTRPFSDLIYLPGYCRQVMLLLLDIDSHSPDEKGPSLSWWELGLY